MPIYALGALQPTIDPTAFVHPDAVVIGSVTIGPRSSIWPGAVLRGDEAGIVIGSDSNVQDNCVIHNTVEEPTTIGDRCLLGHLVHLEGCTIEDDAMVANAAMVLHRSIVHSWAIVAANSVVLNDVDVPSGALAVGSPAVIKLGRARRQMIEEGAASYVRRAQFYAAEMRRIG
jgi:carbonic anhydrase/acetyltransferase-like protein (isoleucine patch superfamily)